MSRSPVVPIAFAVLVVAALAWVVATLDVVMFRKVIGVAAPVLLLVAAWLGWRAGRPRS